MDSGLIFVFGTTTRVTGAGSQAGPTLVPGNWYTLTAKAAFRIVFAASTAAAPTALATSLFIPAGRWDFVPIVGQEKCAVIDDAGGTVEVFFVRSDGGQ